MALVLEQLHRAASGDGRAPAGLAFDACARRRRRNGCARARGPGPALGRTRCAALGYVIAGVVVPARWPPCSCQSRHPAPGQAMPLAVTLPALRRAGAELPTSCLRGCVAAINAALTALFLLGILPLLAGRCRWRARWWRDLLRGAAAGGRQPDLEHMRSSGAAAARCSMRAVPGLAGRHPKNKRRYDLNAHIIGTRIRAHALNC